MYTGLISLKYFAVVLGLNAALTHHKYDLVILMGGTNDALRDIDSKVTAFAVVLMLLLMLLLLLLLLLLFFSL
jgi:hypothetical protein